MNAEPGFTKGYKYHGYANEPVSDACGDGKHSECTFDLTKCHCKYRAGHNTMHSYANPTIAAPQPVADPAPPPTPSVSTPYKNGDAQKWFEDYCYGHHINFAKRIETGGEDSKRLDELVPEILEAFLDQFFPQGTPQVEEISREIAEKLAAMHLIVWQGLGQAMDEYAKETAAILRKHGVGAPAQPGTEEKK